MPALSVRLVVPASPIVAGQLYAVDCQVKCHDDNEEICIISENGHDDDNADVQVDDRSNQPLPQVDDDGAGDNNQYVWWDYDT